MNEKYPKSTRHICTCGDPNCRIGKHAGWQRDEPNDMDIRMRTGSTTKIGQDFTEIECGKSKRTVEKMQSECDTKAMSLDSLIAWLKEQHQVACIKLGVPEDEVDAFRTPYGAMITHIETNRDALEAELNKFKDICREWEDYDTECKKELVEFHLCTGHSVIDGIRDMKAAIEEAGAAKPLRFRIDGERPPTLYLLPAVEGFDEIKISWHCLHRVARFAGERLAKSQGLTAEFQEDSDGI